MPQILITLILGLDLLTSQKSLYSGIVFKHQNSLYFWTEGTEHASPIVKAKGPKADIQCRRNFTIWDIRMIISHPIKPWRVQGLWGTKWLSSTLVCRLPFVQANHPSHQKHNEIIVFFSHNTSASAPAVFAAQHLQLCLLLGSGGSLKLKPSLALWLGGCSSPLPVPEQWNLLESHKFLDKVLYYMWG